MHPLNLQWISQITIVMEVEDEEARGKQQKQYYLEPRKLGLFA